MTDLNRHRKAGLPNGWNCNIRSCSNHDAVGSEHSCNGGNLHNCPIAQGLMSPHDKEALMVGAMAIRDSADERDRCLETRAYFTGKRAAEAAAEES